LMSLLNRPSGLILVTGPAGAGKTTTLYACLKYLNDGSRKINTIEDPIELAMPGIRQSEVRPKIDLGFPELIRSVLRQAPDVIMLGEIRDPVTAETAVLAANSGHLVFATLHAPVAAGAINSMLALGANPHFLSACLLGVLSQRLVRRLCDECKVAFDLSGSPHTFDDVREWLEPGQGERIWSARGCEQCHFEGFTGRIGVAEVLRVSRAIREAIHERRSTREIRQKAVEEGMLDLRRSALLKVAQGITSTEEVIRTIPTEHLLPDQ
jgi:type II secretory ATPase GspE/PulE/Tfp pilus assembly ATPase PilB-like protein